MLTPTKVSTKTECIQRINSLLHSEETTESNSQLTQLTKDNFMNSTDHRVVYKNFDYNTAYDAWIYEGNDKDKIVGYKYLQSYPYDTPKFKIGDYIHWNFNHKELSTWILTSLDTEYLYNVKGRMLQCNNSLRWTDDKGEINCYPCVIEDALTYTNFKWGNKGVVESGGDIVVIVQRNKYTSEIKVNDRFLFDNVGFRVKQFFNELNPNYLELYMMKAPELEDDDFKNNIAINNQPKEDTALNDIVLLPNVKEIMLGEKKEFNIYNYVNGEKQDDTFTIKVKGVPQKYFNFVLIDGNNFTIENLKQYQINPLEIECIDDITGNKINKKIWLGGNW
nr:MAG TPA: head closure knob [Caudoviricetes sp.]